MAQQERLIELLRERKQLVIQRAVTRGLDAGVAMKDSGVAWIGSIPAHWNVLPIRRVMEVRDGTHDTPNYIEKGDETFYLITSKDFSDGQVCFDNAKSISKKDYQEIIRRSGVEEHDLIMSMIGGNIGKSVIADSVCDYAIKNVALFKVRGNAILSRYFKYYLDCGLLDHQIAEVSRGGAQGFMSLGDIRNILFFDILPSEMKIIVESLDKVIIKMKDAINIHLQQITKLKEYRATLIDAAVTGKVRVG